VDARQGPLNGGRRAERSRSGGHPGAPPAPATPLREVAALFLRLGTVAFGGPAAHVAMMEDEVVRRRRWLSREQFLDYVGATNLIPGPNSTELAIHIGHARAGWPGLLVAGACFILPAALIVGGLAWAYVRYGALPQAEGLLYGVKPVVIAVVLQALWGLGRSAVRSAVLAALGAAALAAAALGAHELACSRRRAPRRRSRTACGAGPAGAARPARRLVVRRPTRGADGRRRDRGRDGRRWCRDAVRPLGAVRRVREDRRRALRQRLRAARLPAHDLVARLGWLTERQLLDAVAVGQVTPGPVFTTATFVGYVIGGPAGAAVATVGIFLPAFVFVALSGPLVPRLRGSPAAAAVLDGVNVASLALMAVVTAQLGRAALVDPLTAALAGASALLLVRFRVNSAWLVVGGAAVGLLAHAARLP
jgi:chromate transporter